MKPTAADFVIAYEAEASHDSRFGHRAVPDSDAAQQMSGYLRAWYGDVFFDHVNGVREPAPSALCAPDPFVLVEYWRGVEPTFDSTRVRLYRDPAALLADARAVLAGEHVTSYPYERTELQEVYGIRVREHVSNALLTELLPACIAAPDDDAPRLVLADAVGGERGELIVVQCDLARGGLDPAESARRCRRQRELLAAHGAAWSGAGIGRSADEAWTGISRLADRWLYRRGFVEAAQLEAEAFMTNAASLLFAAPLLSCVSLTATSVALLSGEREGNDPLDTMRRLFAHPALHKLRGLELRDVQIRFEIPVDAEFPSRSKGLGDGAVELAVEQGVLSRLRAFGVRGSELGLRGMQALTSSGALTAMERLWFPDLGLEAARLLLAGPRPNLRSLALGGFPDSEVALLAPLFPPTLVELALVTVTDDAMRALAASPVALSLERLLIDHYGHPRRDASVFAKFPRLRSLHITEMASPANPGYAATTAQFVDGLVALALPELRELYVYATVLTPSQLRAIATAFGPQLELLDLRGQAGAIELADELAEHVAGELLVGPFVSFDRLLHVGTDLREPCWDQPIGRRDEP